MRKLPIVALAGATLTAGCGVSKSAPHAVSVSGPTSASSSGTRTIDGPIIDTQYGPVQVAATIGPNGLTNVTPIELPSDRPRSQFLSTNAAPILAAEALAAHSAKIDTVSGASSTSEAFAQSLQGAIDSANAR